MDDDLPPLDSTESAERTAGRLMGAVRDARGLTQRDVAARLGKSRTLVSMVEAGHRGLRLEDAAAWGDAVGADAFDVERLVRACRGLFWDEDDLEWVFYLEGVTDVTRAEGDWDERAAYEWALERLVKIVNDLADPLHDRRVASWTEEGVIITKGAIATAPITIEFPLAATAFVSVSPQGSRADVDELLGQLTETQVALVAAFIRGVLAQARARGSRPGPSPASRAHGGDKA